MVDSGIKVAADTLKEFTDSMTKRSSQKFDYMIFEIQKREGKRFEEVVTTDTADLGSSKEKVGDKDLKGVTPEWYSFIERLSQDNHPKFGVCYLEYQTKDGRSANKLFFVYWCSEDSKASEKMKYSSTKQSVTKSFGSALVIVQASDKDDLDYKEMIIKAGS